MRRTGEIVKRYSGDEEAAKQYLGVARVLLGRMKSYLAGAYGSREWRLADGTVIVTKSIPSGDLVSIFRPEFSQAVEFHEHGIEATRSATTKFLFTRSGLFAPNFNIRQNTDKQAGTLQWKGQGERDMVWIVGPESRYFVRDPDLDLSTTIYTHDNRPILFDGVGQVYGAAIYRGLDGTGYVVAHGDDTEMRFSIRKEGAWEEIGTPITMPAMDRINTVCMFHPLGNKAVFVTKYGAIVEATLTYTGFSFTETPRLLYRHAGFGPVGGRIIYTDIRTITETTTSTLDVEDSDYSASRVERQRLDPDDLNVVLAAGPVEPWEQVIAAEYSAAGEIITASIRYSGSARKVVATGEQFVGGSTINRAVSFFLFTGPDVGDENEVGQGADLLGVPYKTWLTTYLEDEGFVLGGLIAPPGFSVTATGTKYNRTRTENSSRSPFGLSRSLNATENETITASQDEIPFDFEARIVFSTGDASLLLYRFYAEIDVSELSSFDETFNYSYTESPRGTGTSDYDYSYERTENYTFDASANASHESFEGTIRFLDIRSQSAVIGAMHITETISLTVAGGYTYNVGPTSGTTTGPTSGPDPDGLEGPAGTVDAPDKVLPDNTYNGLATRTMTREDHVYQDGVETKSASRVVRQYNRTLSSPGGSQIIEILTEPLDVIRRNTPESVSDTNTVPAAELPEGAGQHFNALVFHTFGLSTAACASLTLRKYNFFFSTGPFTLLFADDGPMNILYLDDEFRSVPDIFGNDVVYFPIKSL